MNFVKIDITSKWIENVIKLGDANRFTVGFMPRQAFFDYASKGNILGLIENDTLVAYIMFRYRGSALVIVHLCVKEEYQHCGFAKRLVEYLFEQEKDYFSQMQLSCRRDYELEQFWCNLGFVPSGERTGRAVKKSTILTTWTKINPDYPNLLLRTEPNDKKIAACIDTNIAIDLCNGDDVEVQALSQPFLHDFVEYFVAPIIYAEINHGTDDISRNRYREYIKNHFEEIIISDDVAFNRITEELLSLWPAERYNNTWYDIQHIAFAIVFGAQAFITRDTEWLKPNVTDSFFNKYNLRIVSPGEFVRSIDEINSPDDYSPQRLAGLNLQYSEMASADFDKTVEAFYQGFVPSRKKPFQKFLRSQMAKAVGNEQYHLMIVKSEDTPVALITYEFCNEGEKINGIYVNDRFLKKSLIGTLVKFLVFKLLDQASKNKLRYIKIETDLLSPDVVYYLKECDFLQVNSDLVRFIIHDVVKPTDFMSVSELDEDHPINRLINDYSNGIYDERNVILRTINLEKTLWPMKVELDTIPCYIVPIKANYAIELFDEKLSNLNISLYGSDKIEPALSIEKVYFKSPKRLIRKYPARILWYVSRNNNLFETGAIRACSYLDSVETLEIKSAYKKYQRLGVLDWHSLQRIAGQGQTVAVYRFSYTELFDQPIGLNDIRRILKKETATMQSYIEISNQQFLCFYKEGIKKIWGKSMF